MLGPNQPVNLQLIETEPGMKPLSGVTMELADCAFPLLRSVQSTTDLEAGFGDAGLAILVGARPRSKGMERGDLLTANASIFAAQGAALNAAAARDAPGQDVAVRRQRRRGGRNWATALPRAPQHKTPTWPSRHVLGGSPSRAASRPLRHPSRPGR